MTVMTIFRDKLNLLCTSIFRLHYNWKKKEIFILKKDITIPKIVFDCGVQKDITRMDSSPLSTG